MAGKKPSVSEGEQRKRNRDIKEREERNYCTAGKHGWNEAVSVRGAAKKEKQYEREERNETDLDSRGGFTEKERQRKG